MVKCSASALALALSLSPAAFAETTDTHTDIILVTATRSPADAESLPASVTVLDREQIDIEAQVTLSDLLTTVPGMQAVQSGPAGSLTSVFIRGANAKHTLALYDGIRINDASSATGVFNFGSETLGDTGRVEVIRGPLSSVHGSDAVSGVINILPRALSTEGVAPRAALELGELGTLRASAGVDLARESWRLGVSVEQLTTEGYDVTPARLSTATGDPDGAEFRTLTARGEVDLTGGLILDGLYRWRDSRADFDGFSGPPSGFQRADDPDLESEDRLQVWALGLVHEGPALSTRLRAGQVSTALDSFDGGNVTDTYDSTRDFAEARATWQGDAEGGPTLTTGIDWRNGQIDTDTAFNAPLSVNEAVLSLYAIGQVALGDVTVTGSLRYDDYDAFGGETTHNLGAVWSLEPLSTRLRASWGTSFKAPTLSERFASSAFVTPNPDLAPETGETAELGFDTRLDLDGADVELGAAWYTSEIENLIENVFDFTSFTGTNKNIGRADLTGYELYLAVRPTSRLKARIDYTNTDATNGDTGAALLRRPEHAVTASLTWQASERLTLNTRLTHTGERFDVTYDDDGFFVSRSGRVDSYQLVGVSGRFAVNESTQLYARVSNLFDQTYEQPAAFSGAPRTLSVGVRWQP